MSPLIRINSAAVQMHLYPCMYPTIGNASEMDSGQPNAHVRAGTITMCPSRLDASSLVGDFDPGNMP
jgi:hypothetical protein